MKRKLIFGAMLVCLLALGLTLVGCPNDSSDGITDNQEQQQQQEQPKFTLAQQGTWVNGDSNKFVFGETQVIFYYNEEKRAEFICRGKDEFTPNGPDYIALAMECTWSTSGRYNKGDYITLFFLTEVEELNIGLWGQFTKQ